MPAPTDHRHQRMTAAVRAELWRAAWASVFEAVADAGQRTTPDGRSGAGAGTEVKHRGDDTTPYAATE
jgi:hypothetical protein